MAKKFIRITHKTTGARIADGPIGWGITPFEGNLYIRKKFLQTDGFRPNYIPGFCPYKFLYVWMDLKLGDSTEIKNLGWLYWLPNPIFPFIWFRVGIPRHHPELQYEEYVRES